MKHKETIISLVNEIVLSSLPLFYYFLIYQYLPPEIPIHYSFEGIADRFVSKFSVEAFFVCCLGYLGLLLGLILRKMVLATGKTQKNSNTQTTEKIMAYNQTILTVFFTALSLYFIFVIQKNIVPNTYYIFRVAYLVLAVLFVIIGNYLPKLRRNKVSGVKTKYSQSSDDSWMNTQRFSSRIIVVGGIAILLVCLIPSFSMKSAVVLSTVIFAIIFLAIFIFSARRWHHK